MTFLIAVIALYPDNRFDLVFVPELFIQSGSYSYSMRHHGQLDDPALFQTSYHLWILDCFETFYRLAKNQLQSLQISEIFDLGPVKE